VGFTHFIWALGSLEPQEQVESLVHGFFVYLPQQKSAQIRACKAQGEGIAIRMEATLPHRITRMP
jgi:hypothetical protein